MYGSHKTENRQMIAWVVIRMHRVAVCLSPISFLPPDVNKKVRTNRLLSEKYSSLCYLRWWNAIASKRVCFSWKLTIRAESLLQWLSNYHVEDGRHFLLLKVTLKGLINKFQKAGLQIRQTVRQVILTLQYWIMRMLLSRPRYGYLMHVEAWVTSPSVQRTVD